MVAALDPKESAPASHDQKYRTRLPETELVAGWCEMAAIEGSRSRQPLWAAFTLTNLKPFLICTARENGTACCSS
jgi:hypothetical protein